MNGGENPRYRRAKIAAASRSRLDSGRPTHSREPRQTPAQREAQRDADAAIWRRVVANMSPEERQALHDQETKREALELFRRLSVEQQIGALAAVGVELERVIDMDEKETEG
ncbi:MAG: hypothetical protein ABIP74_04030 [Candidatus Saccharimonas sp.]